MIINKTPERAQKWQQAIANGRRANTAGKKRSRSQSRRSNGSSSRGTKFAKMDEEFEKELAGLKEEMAKDRALSKQQVDVMRDIKDGLQTLASWNKA